MAELYEAALESLCTAPVEGKRVRPKLIASTATVRRPFANRDLPAARFRRCARFAPAF
jgi:hypothetical protein